MLTLAIDTATLATTVAVVEDGEVLAERTAIDGRRHAELLVPNVYTVLADARHALADLDRVVVGVGPGMFTGLRVGLATAQALGDALAVPVEGVMTLDAMAFGAEFDGPFMVVTDARRKELFWATYRDAATRELGPHVDRPDVVVEAAGEMTVVGADRTPFGQLFRRIAEPGLPSAAALGRLANRRTAEGRSLLPVRPLYLRVPDVSPVSIPKSVHS